jgi:hypothetical protein
MSESTTPRRVHPPAIRCPIFKEICCQELCAAFMSQKNSCTLCGSERLIILDDIAKSLAQISTEMRRR